MWTKIPSRPSNWVHKALEYLAGISKPNIHREEFIESKMSHDGSLLHILRGDEDLVVSIHQNHFREDENGHTRLGSPGCPRSSTMSRLRQQKPLQTNGRYASPLLHALIWSSLLGFLLPFWGWKEKKKPKKNPHQQKLELKPTRSLHNSKDH